MPASPGATFHAPDSGVVHLTMLATPPRQPDRQAVAGGTPAAPWTGYGTRATPSRAAASTQRRSRGDFPAVPRRIRPRTPRLGPRPTRAREQAQPPRAGPPRRLSCPVSRAKPRTSAVPALTRASRRGGGFGPGSVLGIPASVTELETGVAGTGGSGLPKGAFHVRNDYGVKDFGGAAPPAGD